MTLWKMRREVIFVYFCVCDSLNILGDLKVFEDDHLMRCKPRETALLSHRDASVPAQLFTKTGTKAGALGQVNLFEA